MEIVNILQELLCVRIATDFDLFDDVNVAFFFLCHYGFQLYKK